MVQRLTVLLTCLVLLLALPAPARAATCVPPEHQIPQLDVIVQGRIVAIPEPGLLRLEATRYYKGSGDRFLTAEVPGLGSGHRMDWQAVPRAGDPVIIGLRQQGDVLRNDLCTLFVQLNHGQTVAPGLLGPGQAPAGATPAPAVLRFGLPAAGLALLAAALLRVRLTRAVKLTAALLTLDQVAKLLATGLGDGRRLLLTQDWGLTYVINPGIWVSQSLPPARLPWLQLVGAAVCTLFALYAAYYQRQYRPSPWLDLALGCMIAATLGNLFLDRWAAGGARDFLITPIATANLADLYPDGMLIAVFAEMILYPPARALLKPGRWGEDFRRFLSFIRTTA